MTDVLDHVVYVVDDEPDIREAVRMLLRSVGLKVETFSRAQEFLQAYHPKQPGCLVLDIRMPGMSGPELQETLRRKKIALPVIFITGHGDVPLTVRTMKAGAITVLEKPFNDQLLLDAVQQALEHDRHQRMKQGELDSITAMLLQLTPRETEVLERVVKGTLNKLIAAEFDLSIRTVEIHRARIMKKMQAESLPELVHMMMLIDSDSAAQ